MAPNSRKPKQKSSSLQKSRQWGFVLAVLFFMIGLGVLPVFMLQRDAKTKQELLGISFAIKSLEAQHVSLTMAINDLAAEAKDEEAITKSSSINSASSSNNNNKTHLDSNAKTASIAQTVEGAITFNTPSSSQSQSVLVVGGTDGSGTRRVVQILTQLGVTMVSEDPETYDIHADAVGGWPPIVSPVIEQAKSLAYDPITLPAALQTKMKTSLQTLLDIVESDSHKPTSYVLAKGGALPRPKGISVSRIKYGFKAPVAMTLAPYWAYMLPHFRLLHVLRDGRDIAFSANQGPVAKFFTAMYGHKTERDELKAIRLWSDWNAQLKQWAMDRVTKFDSIPENAEKSFGYFAIHTEDLVDENKDVRFAAIVHLAKWVGSDISDKELCCLAMQGSKFLGSHDRTEKNQKGANNLCRRYGKWRRLFQIDPNLGQQLSRLGAAGLKAFGYEPMRVLASSGGSVDGKVCALAVADCAPVPGEAKQPPSPPSPNVQASCTPHSGVDYPGGDLEAVGDLASGGSPLDTSACCQRCHDTPACRHFTMDIENHLCFLKGESVGPTVTGVQRLISGDLILV
jgi:hypothetical protein